MLETETWILRLSDLKRWFDEWESESIEWHKKWAEKSSAVKKSNQRTLFVVSSIDKCVKPVKWNPKEIKLEAFTKVFKKVGPIEQTWTISASFIQ